MVSKYAILKFNSKCNPLMWPAPRALLMSMSHGGGCWIQIDAPLINYFVLDPGIADLVLIHEHYALLNIGDTIEGPAPHERYHTVRLFFS